MFLIIWQMSYNCVLKSPTQDSACASEGAMGLSPPIYLVIEESKIPKRKKFHVYIGNKNELIPQLIDKYPIIETSLSAPFWPLKINDVKLYRERCPPYPYVVIIAYYDRKEITGHDTLEEAQEYAANREIDHKEQLNIVCDIKQKECGYYKVILNSDWGSVYPFETNPIRILRAAHILC
jgi:hypothetical protein